MKFAALCFLALIASSGCHNRPDYYVGPSIKGLVYSATATITGANRDTLTVRVVTRNGSTEATGIEFYSCSRLNPVSMKVRSRKSIWDSRTWEIQQAQRARDRSPSRVQDVCAGTDLMMTFPSGAVYTFGLSVPVSEILSDSLSGGRYRVTAQLQINGRSIDNLAAGEVEISPGPTPNTR